jgi:uncharacterized phage protein gp47/JayE
MPKKIPTLSQMNSDSLRYLSNHTELSYLAEGSITRALVESSNLEIARLAEYIVAVESNSFVDSATGPYLDLIGKMFGLVRGQKATASISQTDRNVKLSVPSGRLGDHFPDPGNGNQGKVPTSLELSTLDNSIKYRVGQAVFFDKNAKEVFIPAVANAPGIGSNLGAGRLSAHTGPVEVNVTNLKQISSGREIENDAEFRFRIVNNLAASPTGTETAIRVAALGNSDISNVILREFARGAGTFDALVVPVTNAVSSGTRDQVTRAIESVSAFGVNSRVVEPDYIRFKVSIQLLVQSGAVLGSFEAAKVSAANAVLDYFETIPIGGELIINRLRSSVIQAVSSGIKDIKILELCLNDRPHIIRNVRLRRDQLFTPDTLRTEGAVTII